MRMVAVLWWLVLTVVVLEQCHVVCSYDMETLNMTLRFGFSLITWLVRVKTMGKKILLGMIPAIIRYKKNRFGRSIVDDTNSSLPIDAQHIAIADRLLADDFPAIQSKSSDLYQLLKEMSSMESDEGMREYELGNSIGKDRGNNLCIDESVCSEYVTNRPRNSDELIQRWTKILSPDDVQPAASDDDVRSRVMSSVVGLLTRSTVDCRRMARMNNKWWPCRRQHHDDNDVRKRFKTRAFQSGLNKNIANKRHAKDDQFSRKERRAERIKEKWKKGELVSRSLMR